jgi:hypothetical protein
MQFRVRKRSNLRPKEAGSGVNEVQKLQETADPKHAGCSLATERIR